MSWEAITAIGTLATAGVIAITAIAALRQLRIAAAQTEIAGRHIAHLRRATQLQGAMAIFDKMADPEFRDAELFVLEELATKPDSYLAEQSGGHKEQTVIRLFEQIGTYVKNGLLDGDIIFDAMSPHIETVWRRCLPYVRAARRGYPSAWDNFEYLRNENKKWAVARGMASESMLKPDD